MNRTAAAPAAVDLTAVRPGNTVIIYTDHGNEYNGRILHMVAPDTYCPVPRLVVELSIKYHYGVGGFIKVIPIAAISKVRLAR